MSSSASIPATDRWQEFGERWNRFWFTPADPLPLCALRIGVGLCLVLYLLLLTPDVLVWMGDHGMVPREAYRRLVIGGDPVNRLAFWSIFAWLRTDAQVQAVHFVCLAVAVLFTAGVFTRITSVLALVALLQYVHRAPLVASHVEPLLSMLLLYLCIGPCGAAYSFDAWRRDARAQAAALAPSWTANISLRLIQVHLAMFYVMMATAKLQGEIWWRGDAIWTLMSTPRSRLLDWSFMRNWGYFINFWTHLHLFFELTFAALVWPRLTRPVMLWLSVVLWTMMLFASGLVTFSLLMMVASLAFVPADALRRPR